MLAGMSVRHSRRDCVTSRCVARGGGDTRSYPNGGVHASLSLSDARLTLDLRRPRQPQRRHVALETRVAGRQAGKTARDATRTHAHISTARPSRDTAT